LPHDNALDTIQVQKAATPVEGRKPVDSRSDVEKACAEIAQQRPNAVVLERSGGDGADLNARFLNAIVPMVAEIDRSANSEAGHTEQDYLNTEQKRRTRQGRETAKLQTMLRRDALVKCYQLFTPYLEEADVASMASGAHFLTHVRHIAQIDDAEMWSNRNELADMVKNRSVQMHQFIVATGSGMMNQFEPWYFGVAFAFCFNSARACPTCRNGRRLRGTGGAKGTQKLTWLRGCA
jgi:hypothetical protein